MPIYKGTLKTGSAYKGGTSLSRIYKGAYLVFEAFKTLIAEGVPPLTLLNCAAEIMLGYRIYGNSKQQLLPDGYTQLEYIESAGTQYIDTGITATDNTGIKIKYRYTASGSSAISGIFMSTSPRRDTLFISSNSGQTGSNLFCAHRGVTFTTSTDIVLNTDYTCEINYLNSGEAYFGDTLLGNVGSNDVYNKTIPLFARYSVGGSNYAISNSRIYYAIFSEGNAISKHFIPAKRNYDNVLGMYDIINNEFKTNVGTGTFTAGAEMPNPNSPIEIQSVGDKVSELPYGYIELNYIEANGAQYIDTGFSPDGNTRVDYKVETTDGAYDASPFIGARVGSANTARFFPIAYNNTDGECRTSFGSKTNAITNVTAGTVLEGSFDPANGVSTVNSTDYDISSASFQKTDNYNLYLFATTGYTDNLYLSHGKIYYCKIWDNGTLVRNFIPCKNTSNVVGMYDTVNKVFYSSETSEPLIAGNETARGGYRIPVVVSPINIWNPNGTDYGWLNINGTFAPSQGSSRRIETEYGKTYTYWSYRSDGNFYNCIALLDENMNMISGTRVVNSGNTATKMQTITINNSSAKYLLCAYYTGGSTLAPEKNMIVEGNTVSSYEPYFSPTTTNIYLSEPLRKLGSYSDYIDFESGKVVRKINYNETTGLFNEIARYSNYSRYGGYQFSPRNAINLGVEKCNYLPYTQTPNGFIVGANTGASFYLYDDLVGVTAEDDTGAKRVAKAVAWLRSLSPRLRIYYVLETTSEESVTLPEITLNKGTNIISIGTTTQPSDMWIKYKGK